MYSARLLIRGVFGTLMILMFLSRSCMANCPPKSDSVPLDISQFSGQWVILAATPTSGKSVSKCCTLAITTDISSDTIGMNYTAVSRRTNRPVVFIMNGKADDGDLIGTWQLRGSERLLGPFEHRFIAARYDSYLVMVVCASDTNDIAHQEFAMILSRDFTLSQTILQDLKATLFPYFSSDMILDIDHGDC